MNYEHSWPLTRLLYQDYQIERQNETHNFWHYWQNGRSSLHCTPGYDTRLG